MRYSKKDLKIRVDYNNMMASVIGRSQGITETELDSISSEISKAYNFVAAGSGIGMMGWTKLATGQDDVVEDILATAKQIRRNFEYFVVLGIGGSALGPIAAFKAINHLHYNDLKKSKRKGPKFYVEDNVDPERMAALLDVIEPEKTMFNVVTKSGSTSETMTQYLIINDILVKALGDKARDHIIATTSKSKGNLIKIAAREGYKTFYIPDGVGGRFSELCPVGLLPAAVLGIDIKGLLQGAAFMQEQCESAFVKRNPGAHVSCNDQARQEYQRNDALCGRTAIRSRLVCSALGREPGQEQDSFGSCLQCGTDSRQGARRNRSALAGSAVYGRSLR